ncbi:hypothetical protein U5801_07455 [Lamprobacter modestohalophilus]|jgi:Fe-S-cluster containining protein|uniref:hypothetical protein n=1 Tax=Chromatiaceae TaxID=1046 RepID=UPI001F5B667A|nr:MULTISPECIES: hypothetical protein [Chromatiaceae]MEA1049642.1 hypothetical protein [Lamprobacter modestohalophilus]
MHTTPPHRRQTLLELITGLVRKVQRFVTSLLLPVDAGRRGDCNRCGACCKLPYPCPFLRVDAEGLSSCAVYYARPPSCRKYPRTVSENVTPATCGYYFVDVTEIGRAQPATEQAGG